MVQKLLHPFLHPHQKNKKEAEVWQDHFFRRRMSEPGIEISA
jgi:hypothetical protein